MIVTTLLCKKATSIYDEEQDIPVTFASNIMSNFSFEDADWFAGSIEPRMVHPEHVCFFEQFLNDQLNKFKMVFKERIS